jgi:hypothetical protein
MPYDLSLKSSPNDSQEASLKKINGILWDGLAGADGLGPSPGDDEEDSLKKINGVLYLSRVSGGSDLPSYTLKTADFTAEAGKAYAVGAKLVLVVVPQVLGNFTVNGIVFTAKTFPGAVEGFYVTTAENVSEIEIGEFYIYVPWDGDNGVALVTLADVIDAINADGDSCVTASLAEGADPDALFSSADDTGHFNNQVEGTLVEETQGLTVTLPSNPPEPSESGGECIVADFADTNGTWDDYPITLTANRAIEGQESNFVNNAAGTSFRVLFVGGDKGWRILTAGTQPLNITAPVLSGTYAFTSTVGTWTGSPSSFAYQWQISDDGETGWADIEGATSASYLAIEAQEEKFVRCGVIATNANGPSAEIFTESSIAIVVPGFPMTDLVAFWKLSDLTDASGNGNTLTNNNSVTFGAGLVGNAAEFAENFLTRASLPPASQYTISGWFRPNSTVYSGQMEDSARPVDMFPSWGPVLQLTDGDWLYAHYNGAGFTVHSWAAVESEWQHVVITNDGSTSKIYFNGTEIFSTTEAVTPEFQIGNDLCIGAGGDGAYMAYDGKIDCFDLHSRALTAPEIALLYASGAGLEPA